MAVTTTFAAELNNAANASSYAFPGFAPAIDDLIVVFVDFTASLAPGATFAGTDDQGGTYVEVYSGVRGGAHTSVCLVRTALVTSTSSHVITVTCTGDAATHGAGHAYRVAGMELAGTAAFVQGASDTGTGGGTPDPVFAAAADANNPTFGMFAEASTGQTITEPSGWTEGRETQGTSPTSLVESAFRDSGFSGTTITWGSAATAAYLAITVELEAPVGGGGGGSTYPGWYGGGNGWF